MSRLHDADTKRAGLVALAATGSPKLAKDALDREGIDIPYGTLYDWEARHADEIQRLSDQIAPKLEAKLANAYLTTALLAQEEAQAMVLHARDQREADKVKDAAGAARNLATTAAILTDKRLLLQERPTQITEAREPSRLIEGLARKGIRVTVGETLEGQAKLLERGSSATAEQ